MKHLITRLIYLGVACFGLGVFGPPCVPVVRAEEGPAEARDPLRRPRPVYFDPNRIALDCLNDDVPVPEAFAVQSGSVGPSGHIAFRVYAIQDNPPYTEDVTTAFKRHRLRLRAIPTNGSREVAGRVGLDDTDPEGPRLVYTPKRPYLAPREAVLEFQWQNVRPPETFRARFRLHIPSLQPCGDTASLSGIGKRKTADDGWGIVRRWVRVSQARQTLGRGMLSRLGAGARDF